MNLYDVNLLIYAHRVESEFHSRVKPWPLKEMSAPHRFRMSELVLSSFLGIVTNPRSVKRPTPVDEALKEASLLRENPFCVPINPGPNHFEIFTRLCRQTDAKGNWVSDAYLAALAIENGCRWFTFDRDYAKFPGLDWAIPDPA